MQTQKAAQQPSPMRIFEAFNAYQKTAALKAAIDLELNEARYQNLAMRIQDVGPFWNRYGVVWSQRQDLAAL